MFSRPPDFTTEVFAARCCVDAWVESWPAVNRSRREERSRRYRRNATLKNAEGKHSTRSGLPCYFDKIDEPGSGFAEFYRRSDSHGACMSVSAGK
jgi:hypothetical protein